MARVNETLRKIGKANRIDEPPPVNKNTHHDSEERDGEETDHDRYRRRQARLADSDTLSSLPIKVVVDQEVKPQPGSRFEGPVDKLAEKYKDPREVIRHMTIGQYMRYELKGGQIWEGDTLVYDGTEHMTNS
jgi:hypothetical protein